MDDGVIRIEECISPLLFLTGVAAAVAEAGVAKALLEKESAFIVHRRESTYEGKCKGSESRRASELGIAAAPFPAVRPFTGDEELG